MDGTSPRGRPQLRGCRGQPRHYRLLRSGRRVQKQDKDLIAKINDNDGNLNYKRGIISNAVKLTSDLDIRYQNIGLFVRGTGFFDPRTRTASGSTRRSMTRPRPGGQGHRPARRVRDRQHGLRRGVGGRAFRQARAHWGESTFIQNGINAVNPFDVSKLRVPGAELREALVAVPLVSTVMELPGNFSLEGFYQLDWDKTEIDPLGTFLDHRLRRPRGHDGRTSTIPISTRRWKAIPFPTRPCWGTIPSSWSSAGRGPQPAGRRTMGRRVALPRRGSEQHGVRRYS